MCFAHGSRLHTALVYEHVSKCGSEKAACCLLRPAHFFSNVWGSAILKLNTEPRVYRPKFGI